MKRNDVILLLSVLFVGLAGLLGAWLLWGDQGEVAVVTVDGEEYARLPLDTDTELLIESANGGTNLLVIRDGTVCITEASCPDRVCVKTGHADPLRSIVCLPNRVTVTVERAK